MSHKCVVMFRCHHALLHHPSTPPRDVTPDRLHTPETPPLGVSCLPLTHPRFPDFPCGGTPMGWCCRWQNRYLFSLWIHWRVFAPDKWLFGLCDVFCDLWLRALFPFFYAHTACTHIDRHTLTLVHPHLFSPSCFFLSHTHLTATHSVNMKAVCRPWVHNYC